MLKQKPLDTKLERWIVHPFYLRSKGQMSRSAEVCTLLFASSLVTTVFVNQSIIQVKLSSPNNTNETLADCCSLTLYNLPCPLH